MRISSRGRSCDGGGERVDLLPQRVDPLSGRCAELAGDGEDELLRQGVGEALDAGVVDRAGDVLGYGDMRVTGHEDDLEGHGNGLALPTAGEGVGRVAVGDTGAVGPDESERDVVGRRSVCGVDGQGLVVPRPRRAWAVEREDPRRSPPRRRWPTRSMSGPAPGRAGGGPWSEVPWWRPTPSAGPRGSGRPGGGRIRRRSSPGTVPRRGCPSRRTGPGDSGWRRATTPTSARPPRRRRGARRAPRRPGRPAVLVQSEVVTVLTRRASTNSEPRTGRDTATIESTLIATPTRSPPAQSRVRACSCLSTLLHAVPTTRGSATTIRTSVTSSSGTMTSTQASPRPGPSA